MKPTPFPVTSPLLVAWVHILHVEGALTKDWQLRPDGGLHTDPKDPGGTTKYGFSKRANPDIDIPTLTEPKARALFESRYWTPARCPELPQRIAVAQVDGVFILGRSGGVKCLQRAVGAKDDGDFGPKTMAAVLSADPDDLILRYVEARDNYDDHVPGEQHAAFEEGWDTRLFKLMSYVYTRA